MLTRLTWIGAVDLVGVSILPELLVFGLRVEGIPWVGTALEQLLPGWLTRGVGIDFYFGGTSLLIVVSVAIDLLSRLENELNVHNYGGFLRRRSARPGRARSWGT